MLEIEPTGQRSHMTTECGQNGNEAFAGAASEAFARWLHHWYAPVELSLARRAYHFI